MVKMKTICKFMTLSLNWCLIFLVCTGESSQASPPVITRQPVESKFIRGDAGKLFCGVSGDPAPVVTWFKDNGPIPLSKRLEQLDDNSLYFKKVRKRNDDGIYWCVATNSEGNVTSRKAHVTVMYLNRKFKISPKSKDVNLLGPLELRCVPPGGNPPPTIKWKKNFKVIQSYGRMKLEVDSSIYYLRIDKTLQEDSGNYTCVASNDAEERVSKQAAVRVLVPPSITVKDSVVQANEEDNVALSCEASGVPKPIIKWYKGTSGLLLSNRMQTPNRMTIKHIQLSDAGSYTCRAENSQGFVEEKITVIVKMLPKFLIRPGNLKIGVGENARFECKVSAEPGYKIMWQKTVGAQSRLLFKNQLPRIVIGDDDSLTIENVQKEDEATYVCTVISSGKLISATARLLVADSIIPPPEVSVVPFNQTVLEGKDVNITCIAKGTPQPTVYWKTASNDARITNATEGVLLLSNGFKHFVVLKSVRKSDSDSYRCVATNGDRTVSKVAYLNVLPVPKIPDPPDYVDYFNVTDTSVVLRWKASRNPPGAPVTSYIVSVSDVAGRVWKAVASNIKKLEYTVRNLTPNTWYVFRVNAANSVGHGTESRSTGNIKTNSPKGDVRPSAKAFSTTAKPVDKLLDLALTVKAFPRNKADEYNISWVPVKPSDRVKGYEVHWKKAADTNFKNSKVVQKGSSSYCILKGLEPGTPYNVKIRAFNDRYDSAFSDMEAFSTMTEQQVSIPPPHNVKLKVVADGSVLVTWEPSKESRLTGYEIVWIPLDGTSVETKTVAKNITSFLIKDLDSRKAYHVTLALVVNNQPGLKSQKLQITPKLVKVYGGDKNKGSKGGSVDNGNSEDQTPPTDGGTDSMQKGSRDSGIMKTIKEPWFIGSVGGFFCAIISIFVIVIACRRRKRKRPSYFCEQSNGLMQPNRTPVNSINRTRASYRDSTYFWGEQDAQIGSSISANRTACKVSNETYDNERSEMRPLIDGKISDAIEMKSKPVNGDVQKILKEANNLRRPFDSGSVSSSNRETFLNNLKNDKSIESYGSSPKMSLNRNTDQRQGEKPRLKIQGAFESQHADDDDESKKNMLERHAEIVRTSNKKFESDLANCMENNTQATWKREKMKEAPEVLTSGEDTLRRKAKNSFKPMPKLEVLDWADYPATPSKAGSSAGSPPSSPKTSASAFSDNNGSRATSRASQGSTTSLNKYPYGGRSGHAPSVSSRRMSQSSSMMSSELYQSEMDPSVYSDAASEKKKCKNKAALPPPIDLDGLTSDILLQWAESVTNSSPSSSGSSSPSRLSAVSSDGSFLTDEDFAHAVAAVVKCGGFNNYDYSLSNMPGLQAPPQSQLSDHQQKMKMEKIDAMIASKGKAFRGSGGASLTNQLTHRQDTRSPPSVTPISFSSYLSSNAKRTGASSLSNGPYNKHRQRIANPNDLTGLRFGNENESTVSFGTPLTMSNLRQHDSSLGREKHSTKPLTVSNLKQHDSSLERNKKIPVDDRRNNDDDDDDVDDDDVFGGKNAQANSGMAQPLSVTSALERNESLGSTKDSKSSVNSEYEGRGTSERRKDSKLVVKLNDATYSTGTSTASTVKTSQEQSEC